MFFCLDFFKFSGPLCVCLPFLFTFCLFTNFRPSAEEYLANPQNRNKDIPYCLLEPSTTTSGKKRRHPIHKKKLDGITNGDRENDLDTIIEGVDEKKIKFNPIQIQLKRIDDQINMPNPPSAAVRPPSSSNSGGKGNNNFSDGGGNNQINQFHEKKFLTKIHFLLVQKWPKINF